MTVDGDGLGFGEDCVYRVSAFTLPGGGPMVAVAVMLPWSDTTGPLATITLAPRQALELAADLVKEAITATGGWS